MMNLPDDFGQYKSEFARQIAMEEGKAKDMNIWLLKGQHGLRRGTSESLLGRMQPLGQEFPLNRSKLCGSVGSLPSLFVPDKQQEEEEIWVSPDEFKDILDLKESKLMQGEYEEDEEVDSKDIKTLEEENARLRNQLQLAARRSSSTSLVGMSKYQELQRDVAKLQAKICKIENSSGHPVSTRRLVTFLETFKAQLPSIDSPSLDMYGGLLDGAESIRASIGSYRPSLDGFGRPSMGSYRAACHPSPFQGPQTKRTESCVTKFNRVDVERYEGGCDRTDSSGSLLGSEFGSSVQIGNLRSNMSGRSSMVRSRVVMGARTVQRSRDIGGRKVEPSRSYSSSDLLGKSRGREDEVSSSIEEEYYEKSTPSADRSMKYRSKSYASGLSDRKSTKGYSDSGRCTDESSSQSGEENTAEVKEIIKVKDGNKVQKFFSRLKKLVNVSKDKACDKNVNVEVKDKKMKRSLSHRISKSKNVPKRLKSFHCSSSPRL